MKILNDRKRLNVVNVCIITTSHLALNKHLKNEDCTFASSYGNGIKSSVKENKNLIISVCKL